MNRAAQDSIASGHDGRQHDSDTLTVTPKYIISPRLNSTPTKETSRLSAVFFFPLFLKYIFCTFNPMTHPFIAGGSNVKRNQSTPIPFRLRAKFKRPPFLAVRLAQRDAWQSQAIIGASQANLSKMSRVCTTQTLRSTPIVLPGLA